MPMASMLQNMTRLGVLPKREATYAHKIVFEDKPEPQTMFASTDLKAIHRPYQDGDPIDFEYEGRVYRKVDILFWAWLWTRMEMARLAHKNGRMDDGHWKGLQKRFSHIHNHVVDHHPSEALEQAIAAIKQNGYNLPTTIIPEQAHDLAAPEWKYPSQGEYFAFEPVSSDAVRQVENIKDQALALGWTMAGLFQNRGHFTFPIGQDWGLVCFLKESREIRSVSHKFIEIVHHEKSNRTSLLRFQNPDLMRGSILSQGEHNATLRQCPGDPSQGAPRRSPEALLRKPVDPASQSVLRQPQRTRAPVIPKRNHHQGNLSLGKPDHKTSLPNSSRSSSNR